MTNYSRTTLRELKKRYLNVLKKCLLANLMAFSFVLPSMAETVTNPATNKELLEALLDPTKRVEITDINLSYGIVFNDFSSIKANEDSNILNNNAALILRGDMVIEDSKESFVNNGTLQFYGNVYFRNNKGHTGSSLINNIGTVNFYEQKVVFENNIASWSGAAISNGYNTETTNATIQFNNKEISFYKNMANNVGGAIYNYGKIEFKGNDYLEFKDNFVYSLGGAIFNSNALIDFTNINTVVFVKNVSDNAAGVIFNRDSVINFSGKSNVLYLKNHALNKGGAIFNRTATMNYNEGTLVSFIANTSNLGGAIYNEGNLINFNSDFMFFENRATSGNDIFNTAIVQLFGEKDCLGIFEGGIAGSTAGIINKSGDGLLVLGDQSENNEYEGAFTQSAGVTIANSERFFSHEKAVNTINGGELKTHGAEIAYKATLGETGTLTHLGTSADTPTEIKGVTFNGTGLNLTLGTYTKAEQEKEIALVGDRLIEYVDDKGTEDTSDDELVSYQATDKLFTVKALENDQKAKFILNENLTGIEGNSITVAGAELDVKEGLKVAGKVIAKDMTVSKGRAPVSFTEIEVAKSGILDIGTREVTVEDMPLKEGALLKIGVNSLTEHGKVTGLVTGSETSKIALNLAMDTKNGVYQLFDRDNALSVKEDLFFTIKDLENGAYEVSKKTSENLMKDFDMSASESAVAIALIESESAHKVFNQVQEEMLEALQSEDKGKVQKAKKALKAVGTSEQPSSQSIAASHFNELTRVISQMAMEKEAEIVGHSGGDMDPRAKVYIKGLYDRTKSSMGEGFRARSKGAVLGVQSEVTDTLTLGVGYATSQTTAKEDLRRTEVDTNTGFISAHYQPNAWWVSGLATFSRGEYEEEKQILSSMGKASYDVDSWGAQVMTGYDI
ncbi:MAG: autotransporter domain-containing protein, partial [Alphaproteobacteria bacterium]|nr:autotransporter domain-containing protein [Alphaproteobacteria bacterium]